MLEGNGVSEVHRTFWIKLVLSAEHGKHSLDYLVSNKIRVDAGTQQKDNLNLLKLTSFASNLLHLVMSYPILLFLAETLGGRSWFVYSAYSEYEISKNKSMLKPRNGKIDGSGSLKRLFKNLKQNKN